MTKGVVRSIDTLGRIVIPKEYRKLLNITSKDKLEVKINEDVIEIKKYDLDDKFLKIHNLYFNALNSVYPNKVFFCNYDDVYLYNEKRRVKNNSLFEKLYNISEVVYFNEELYLDKVIINGYYIIPIKPNDEIIGFVIIETLKDEIDKIEFINKLVNN